MPDPYEPIDCGFHDRLESLAVTRQSAALTLRSGAGERTLSARIADVFAREGAEFARLVPEEGAPLEVRLDEILAVGGVRRPGAGGASS